MRVRLWIQQRHELSCAARKFQGIGCAMMGGEVSFVNGVLEGALGALGDEFGSLGDRVFVSSWVKSTNNCFGGMMLIFGLLETLEMEALVEAMNGIPNVVQAFWVKIADTRRLEPGDDGPAVGRWWWGGWRGDGDEPCRDGDVSRWRSGGVWWLKREIGRKSPKLAGAATGKRG
ncbi:hypothetical protein Tco_0607841 [Tanacetum coccineum]